MFASILARYRLLTPAERGSWALLSLIGMVMAAIETAVGGLVYALVAFLTNPEVATSRPMLRPILNLLPDASPLTQTLTLLALTGFIHFGRNAFGYFLGRVHLRLSSEASFALSCRLFSQYLRSPYIFHLDRHSTELAAHVHHSSAYVFSILNGAINIMTLVLTAGGLLGLVLYVSPWPAILTSVTTVSILWLFLKRTRRLVETSAHAQRQLEIEVARHVQEGFGSVKETKVLGRESFFTEAYARNKMASLALTLRMHGVGALPRLLVEVVFGVGILFAVAAGAAAGHQSLTALLSLYAYVGIRAIPAALGVANEIGSVRNYIALTDPVMSDLQAATKAPPSAPRVRLRSGIEFRNVGFVYPAAVRSALGGINLHVSKGEFIGIVGPSGAGKTTLGDILLGLLAPTSGEVVVDGEKTGQGVRLVAGYVPQQVFLIDDTLRRNIAFARIDSEIDDARVHEAIRLARLEGLLVQLDQGLETRLKERGARLSGGERQRVAIARALYDDPDVLFLDEATSSLDPATERDLVATLEGLKGAHTVIVVSHRLSTVERCDRIYVMDEGRIVGEGAYEELARTNPGFRSWAGLDNPS